MQAIGNSAEDYRDWCQKNCSSAQKCCCRSDELSLDEETSAFSQEKTCASAELQPELTQCQIAQQQFLEFNIEM